MMIDFQFETIEDIEEQLIDFRILFAYHSNKIENEKINYHDTREIFENGKVIAYTGDLRTLFEISNQKDCYYMLLEKISKKEKLSLELIKQVHYELTKGTYDERRYNTNQERPGEWKKHDYITGIYEVGSNASYVEKDLEELLAEINDYQGRDFLTVAAYFHASFENIHPFADGNGRVGRTLLNYYLSIHHIKPFIIYEEDKNIYYQCLQAFDEDGQLEALKKFIQYEQKKTWAKKERKTNHLDSYL